MAAATGEELMREMAKTIRPADVRQSKSRYDAAQTNAGNRKHWELADSYSAAAANSLAVRKTLRERSRYEVANNGYARGIVNTKTNHVIGTGPRLQVETGDPELDEQIEASFCAWADEINLGAKLRTMQAAKIQDGEAFAVFTTNQSLNHPVKLDIRLVECDRITYPLMTPEYTPTSVDGINYDSSGNPESYTVLRYHPGDSLPVPMNQFDVVNADDMIHWFRADRPGQVRGIPEIMPALPLFAQLRRYTLATISAAETAASFAMVAQSTLAPEDEQAPDPFEEIELTHGMLTVLPQGYSLGQVDPKQPVTGYKEFKWEILGEIGRPLDMPFNITACNSSSYNYSSGRLDHQVYYRGISIEQCDGERIVLNPIFAMWVQEAILQSGVSRSKEEDAALYGEPRPEPAALPISQTKPSEWKVGWFWDGQQSAEPTKDATADQINLENGTTNEAELIARDGGDWRRVLRKKAEILQYKQSLETEYGVTFPTAKPAATNPPSTMPDQQPQGGDYGNAA